MANYKGHIAGGVIAGFSVSVAHYYTSGQGIVDSVFVNADWQLMIGLMVVSTLFALWPDVDTNSKAQNLFYRGAFVIDAVLIWQGLYFAAALLGLLAMTPVLGKHRGWTHSPAAILIVPSPILIFPYISNDQVGIAGLLFYFAAVMGYFSHLLLDGLIFKSFRIKGSWR